MMRQTYGGVPCKLRACMQALMHVAAWHAPYYHDCMHLFPCRWRLMRRAARTQLCDLYENDCIFDKFDCCVNGRGDQVSPQSAPPHC